MNYLDNWDVLNKNVMDLDEPTLKKLLKQEMKENKRTQFLLRLYGRYNILRTERERKEVIAGTWGG